MRHPWRKIRVWLPYSASRPTLAGVEGANHGTRCLSYGSYCSIGFLLGRAPTRERWHNVAIDEVQVVRDAARLLPALSVVGHVSLAEVGHGRRCERCTAPPGRITASLDVSEQLDSAAPRLLGSQDSVQTDRESPCSALRSVLDHVARLAGGEDSQPEAGQLVIPNEQLSLAGANSVNQTLGELCHLFPSHLRLLRKRPGSRPMENAGAGCR